MYLGITRRAEIAQPHSICGVIVIQDEAANGVLEGKSGKGANEKERVHFPTKVDIAAITSRYHSIKVDIKYIIRRKQ